MSNLNSRFLRMFHNSALNLYFTVRPEVRLEQNGISHTWDFVIYRGSIPVMVVDVDGGFFHGDECDYDGLHSKEEYDEFRGQSVMEGIKIGVITEERFNEGFQMIWNLLQLSYDQYVRFLHRSYLSMPFPEPSYRARTLVRSYKKLIRFNSLNNYQHGLDSNIRFGDMLIKHFHPTLYGRSVEKNISPYKVWNTNQLLDRAIRKGIVYHSYLNPNKILQGFNVSDVGKRIPIFSAAKVKILINKYLSEYDAVFDPYCDLGNILLGITASHKKYIGVPVSDVSQNENMNMIRHLKQYWSIDVDMNVNDSEFPCLFTIVNNDDQIDSIMSKYKCMKYLFVVSETCKYKDQVVEEIHSRSKSDPEIQYIILIDRSEDK